MDNSLGGGKCGGSRGAQQLKPSLCWLKSQRKSCSYRDGTEIPQHGAQLGAFKLFWYSLSYRYSKCSESQITIDSGLIITLAPFTPLWELRAVSSIAAISCSLLITVEKYLASDKKIRNTHKTKSVFRSAEKLTGGCRDAVIMNLPGSEGGQSTNPSVNKFIF